MFADLMEELLDEKKSPEDSAKLVLINGKPIGAFSAERAERRADDLRARRDKDGGKAQITTAWRREGSGAVKSLSDKEIVALMAEDAPVFIESIDTVFAQTLIECSCTDHDDIPDDDEEEEDPAEEEDDEDEDD